MILPWLAPSEDRAVGPFHLDELQPGAPVLGSPDRTLASWRRMHRLRLGGIRDCGRRPPLLAASIDVASAAGVPFALDWSWSHGEACVGLAVGERGDAVVESVRQNVGASFEEAATLASRTDPAWAGVLGAPSAETQAGGAEGLADTILDACRAFEGRVLLVAAPVRRADVEGEIGDLRIAAERLERERVRGLQQSHRDRAATAELKRIDDALALLGLAEAGRLWRMALLCSSSSEKDALAIATLVAGTANAGHPAPLAPWRALGRHRGDGGIDPAANRVSGDVLARWCVLPARERPGFAIRESPGFATDRPSAGPDRGFAEVLDDSFATARLLAFDDSQWLRHVGVYGNSGSGKTTTLRAMLDRHESGTVHWLVLQPAKGGEWGPWSDGERARVFRVGIEHAATGFRINPLRFPLNTPLATHVDAIVEILERALALVQPLGSIVREGLLLAYAGAGWNVETGRHANPGDPLAFPTLHEVLENALESVARKGYAPEVERNLSGALRSRLAGLLQGPWGRAFGSVRESHPTDWLTGRVVLDLAFLGDERSSLAMSLILLRFREEIEANGLATEPGLRRLLVVEEAHRLLARRPERGPELGDAHGHGVSTMAAMLAEMRAYGVGIVIVDQLPSRLDPAVVRGCASIVAHRLVAEEDRAVAADLLLLDGSRRRVLGWLPDGEAIVRGSDWHGAVRVRIPKPTPMGGDSPRERPSDAEEPEEVDLAAGRRWLLHERLGEPGACGGSPLIPRSAQRAALEFLARRERWTTPRLEAAWDSLPGVPIPDGADPGRDFCPACPRRCVFGYEGERLARDPEYREAVREAVLFRGEGALGDRLRAAAERGLERAIGWDRGLETAAVYCATGHAMEALGVSGVLRRAVLADVLCGETRT